jgi:hypothetical protein
VAWFRVVGQTFVCAVKVEDGVVVDAAPVLKWILMRRDRSLGWLSDYAGKRRWQIEPILVNGDDA